MYEVRHHTRVLNFRYVCQHVRHLPARLELQGRCRRVHLRVRHNGSATVCGCQRQQNVLRHVRDL